MRVVGDCTEGLSSMAKAFGRSVARVGIDRGTDNIVDLGAIHFEHGRRIHATETEPDLGGDIWPPSLAGNTVADLRIDAHVEDGVHHARHRNGGAAPKRYEQRSTRVAESALGPGSQLLHGLPNPVVETYGPSRLHIGTTDVGGEHESRRNGEIQSLSHLRKRCALAPEAIKRLLTRPPKIVSDPHKVVAHMAPRSV